MPEYDSFLLRVWRSRRHEGWAWALRLEHLQGGARHDFDDPEALVDALWALVDTEPSTELCHRRTSAPEAEEDGAPGAAPAC